MNNSAQGGPHHGQSRPQHQMPPAAQQGYAPHHHAGPGGKAKRRIRNFLLQPLLQVKIGLFSILLSVLFAAALGGLIYFNFFPLMETVLKMTDADEEVRDFFWEEWKTKQLWVYLSFAVYLIAQIAMSILYTHRLVGPTYAFRRHIRSIAEGRFHVRTYLRKGDGFSEVADELNYLSEVMEKHFSGQARQAATQTQQPAGHHAQHGGSGNA